VTGPSESDKKIIISSTNQDSGLLNKPKKSSEKKKGSSEDERVDKGKFVGGGLNFQKKKKSKRSRGGSLAVMTGRSE